jgi:hypothetical protein
MTREDECSSNTFPVGATLLRGNMSLVLPAFSLPSWKGSGVSFRMLVGRSFQWDRVMVEVHGASLVSAKWEIVLK